MEETSLMDFIHNLVEQLMLNTDYDDARLRQAVDGVRADLSSMAAQYDEPAPAGGEAVRELMLECLQLYDSALQRILVFLDDEDEDHLRAAVQESEEANDVLSAVEDMIQTNKNLISEMVEA